MSKQDWKREECFKCGDLWCSSCIRPYNEDGFFDYDWSEGACSMCGDCLSHQRAEECGLI